MTALASEDTSVQDVVARAAAAARVLAPPTLSPTEVRARFATIDTWVFDLDNTLYPAGSPVWPMIDERITRYLANLMGIDGMSARGLQKYYYKRYGTTLKGVIEDHAITPEAFLDFVHDIDRTSLAPNPALVQAIASLPGRKLILTNGSRDHALRTTEQLGFTNAFEAVFDIVSADLVPKPEAATYERFFAMHGVDPSRSAMFEDLAKNLRVPHARGMVTVLIVPPSAVEDNREPWESLGGAEPYIDVVTDDLAGFLAGLTLDQVRQNVEPSRASPRAT